MGYIGYNASWPEVAAFQAGKHGGEERVESAFCHWMPEEKQFHFVFTASSYWYHLCDGKLIRTDPQQLLKYASKGDKLTSEFLLWRFQNQDEVLTWAQSCIDNFICPQSVEASTLSLFT